MEINTIAVIGAGTMGSGIAQTAAQGGFRVILEDIKEGYVRAGFEKIRRRLEKRVSEGKLEKYLKDEILSRITTSVNLKDCWAADLVLEAVIEKEEIKKQLFRQLDGICPEETVFATNTSSISITRLSGSVGRPGSFIGMHFMNPAYAMKLVEVVRGLQTSENTVDIIRKVAEKLGKIPVVVNDSPGFVSNRILMPMINDAIFCLDEGVASREAIDMIMKLGANHPMGPLELADLIGLDICLEILEVLHAELGEKYRPCPLLGKMLADGRSGRKSGKGFYEYE